MKHSNPFAEMEQEPEDFLTEEELLKDVNLNGVPDLFERIENQNVIDNQLDHNATIDEEIIANDLFDIDGF